MKNKKAKFFCENCGTEVKENSKVCNHCGKFFISVRCPNCGNTGHSQEFTKGCPKCGYAKKNTFNSSPSIFNNNNANKKNYFYLKKNNKKNQKQDNSLPLWIYLITTVSFVFIIFLVFSCLVK